MEETNRVIISSLNDEIRFLKNQVRLRSVSIENLKYKSIMSVNRQEREMLIDFSKKIMFGENWNPTIPYEKIVDDYIESFNKNKTKE